MLYVFRVDTGDMVTLETNLALETVAHLQASLASQFNIPVEKQVLLISGGECLEPEERVCKYTAGSSDSNPIFLFSVSTLEGNVPPTANMESYLYERDIQPDVEASLSLPDTYNTVAVRASLAQEYVKVSREQAKLCESLIHDQHLQHQGWAAALANLEDCVLAMEKRWDMFKDSYLDYLERRDHYRKVIEMFDDDLNVLSRIPVLPVLIEDFGTGDSGHSSNGLSSEATAKPVMDSSKTFKFSLLDWMNRSCTTSLEKVADSCYSSLDNMNDLFLENINQRISQSLEGANNHQMKEIRGLGDRLSGLEQLLLDAKKKVSEQDDLAAAFLQNQARASGLKDLSILPDLCASHKQQLLVMMRNHQHILSIRKRCVKAKEELSQNLYTRLKWVVFIQRQMAENHQQLVLFYEQLKRLGRRLEAMEQIHLAPSMYLAAVVEVVRRRSFSDHFLTKAGSLASRFSALHTEEMETRKHFQEKLSKHFLSTMFGGMSDLPPPFAIEKPPVFDDKLPKISLSDLEKLRSEFPDIAESLSVPDKNTLSSLLTRSFTQNLTAEEDNALNRLNNLTNKINISGDGLGSVSVINRICVDTVSRKKTRLEALAASRERELASETDTDDDNPQDKSKASRKMSRSFPTKGFEQKLIAAPVVDKSNVSSSSADPSSSSGPNTNSSNAPSSDGSLLKNNWPSQPDIHNQMEEKSKEIEKLQTLLGEADSRRERVEEKIGQLLGVSTAGLHSVRKELETVKSQVNQDRTDILGLLGEMTGKLMSNLNELEVLKEAEQELRRERQLRQDMEEAFKLKDKKSEEIIEELTKSKETRDQLQADLTNLQDKLETEMGKLEDCNKEIEIYRVQLEDATKALNQMVEDRNEDRASHKQELETLEQEHMAAMEQLKADHEQEKNELRQKMELEHELEFDSFKEKIASSEDAKVAVLEDELQKCREKLTCTESQLDQLKVSHASLDQTLQSKVDQEKDRIVQILEAGFSERQKLALQQLEMELRSSHDKELHETKESSNEEMCSRLEELRQRLIENGQVNLQRTKEKMDKECQQKLAELEQKLREEFSKERQNMDDKKKKEMDEVREDARKKSRMEVENIRSRFKLMQTNASLERSPSVSESELSIESPKVEAADIEERVVQKIQEERAAWEKERLDFKAEVASLRESLEAGEKQLVAERNKLAKYQKEVSHERLRMTSEKQKSFNEALRKVIEDKDRHITELESLIMAYKQGLTPTNSDLEMEVAKRKESEQKMNTSMMSSIAVVASEDNLKQLQEENQQLKTQLSKSMTSIISSAKVSINSVERGELVLVLWSDAHSNYFIYNETQNLHFLHLDSMEPLGLQLEDGVPRKKHCTAEVVDKEYCQARKCENRYRVPQGTKFYRVKCKPVERS